VVQSRLVGTTRELLEAAGDPDTHAIQVAGELSDLPVLQLRPGVSLSGNAPSSVLRFRAGADGVQLSADNSIRGLEIVADPDRRAIFNDTSYPALGRIELSSLRITGNVRLLATGQLQGGHIEAHDIDIVMADARAFDERPSGFGVEVVPGVFTIWNMQSDQQSRITADLTAISAGRSGAPVRGSGVFVAGTPGGGRTIVRRLETGEIHSDGGIAPGTPDRISGGVFTVHGAWVDFVRNVGPVTTYGANDMVLDNWGTVERWQADGKITSYGPSGIGFVNFGYVEVLRVDGVIETFGLGARAFNVYAGTVRDAEFERVVTWADGAVGIQISQPVGRIAVRHGLETHGGVGNSLVKGVVMQLAATALSIKPGGSAREIKIEGGLVSHGRGIEPLELHGIVEKFSVSGSLGSASGGFQAL
jgi:hypothetical protein